MKFKNMNRDKGKKHNPNLDFLRFVGPGLLVTVGFIDPGNWAANLAAGSNYGYRLLWIITLSTIILIILQHNTAHLGIVTGRCLSEAATEHLPKPVSVGILATAMLAAISTAFAEILGGAIALSMLFHIPLKIGLLLVAVLALFLLFFNAYKKLERYIIGFVSLIGFSFVIELFMVKTDWGQVAGGLFMPSVPNASLFIILSVLGAVVMPHNLFLHSEIIQSRHWNLEDEAVIKKQLKYEYMDTIFSMIVGWVINCALIIIAASAFFSKSIKATDLSQANAMLEPLLGNAAAVIFAVALLLSAVSALLTVGIAGGSIFSGIFKEPVDIKDTHTKYGIAITLGVATIIALFVSNTFSALIISQMLLSVQLPLTIFLQIYLTSSKKVMGKYANPISTKIILITIGIVVTALNILLLFTSAH